MATKTIDEFVVAIGLDVKSLTAGQKTAFSRLDELEQKSDKTKKTVQSSGKAMGESFSSVTGELFKLTGAFIGMSAFKNATVEITKADAALGRLSKNLGVDPKSLKAWEGVAAAYGSSADDIDAAFQRTNDVRIKWKEMGTAPTDFSFGAGLLGLDQSAFFDEKKSDEERLIMLQKVLVAHAETTKEGRAGAIVLAEQMGYTRQTAQMLLDTNSILSTQLEKYREMANLDAASAQNAIIRDQAWKSLQSTVEGVYRSMWDGMTELAIHQAALNRENVGDRAPVTAGRLLKSAGLIAADILTDPLNSGEESGLNKKLAEVWKAEPTANDIWRGGKAPVAPATTSTGKPMAQLLSEVEKENGLPKGAMRGLYGTESAFGTDSKDSTAHARGPFQFMDENSKHYRINPYDTEQSAHAAGKLLKELLNHYGGNLAQAYGGYNAGQPTFDAELAAGSMTGTRSNYINRAMRFGPGGEGGANMGSQTTTSINNLYITSNANARELSGLLASNGNIAQYASNNGMPGVAQR